MRIKIVTIIGARPQFIKAAAVSRVIRNSYGARIDEVLIHTGQHYDNNMSRVFFDELDIPKPKYDLEISSVSHGAMTGRMLERIEQVLQKEKPDWVLVYGDTNSTLAGALAAAKLHIPVAHVEAGLRSFNMKMPEEINRILTDRVSTQLFCPSQTAVANLEAEGVSEGVINTGDVMYDVALFYKEKALRHCSIHQVLGIEKNDFALSTCHRAENTDDPDRLSEILAALSRVSLDIPVVLPLHPRTRDLVDKYRMSQYLESLIVIEPLPYLDMVALEQSAKLILTDSGGVQKEAFFYRVPCITMRDETEWVETVASGWNSIAGASCERICSSVSRILNDGLCTKEINPYGDGEAAQNMLSHLVRHYETE